MKPSPFKEEQYVVNLWKENFEQLESKNSHKVLKCGPKSKKDTDRQTCHDILMVN